jgi:hypothetical protein
MAWVIGHANARHAAKGRGRKLNLEVIGLRPLCKEVDCFMENDPDSFEGQILTLFWPVDVHAPNLNT